MKFGYTIVYVYSVGAALAFYEAAFGFKTRFAHDTGTYGELETGDTVLAFASHALGAMNFDGGHLRSDLEQPPLGVELAFVTDDVHAAYSRAVAAGAVALHDPVVKPWGQTVAYVRSNEGTLIELCTPVAA